MPVSGPTLLTCLATLVAGAGLYFLHRGLRPRRTGADPHCRRCNYLLTALASPNCPECGTPITPATTVIGERHRRPGAILIGTALLLIGLSGIVLTRLPSFREIDWYRYRPTSWLIRDLTSGSDPTATRALEELARRRTLKLLPADVEAQITEAMLTVEGRSTSASPLLRDMMEELARRADAGTLTPAQFKRLFQQALHAHLEHRVTYVAGEKAPFTARAQEEIPALRRWQTKATVLAGSFGANTVWCGSSSGPALWVNAMAVADAPGPGRRPLQLTYRIDIFTIDADRDTTQPILSWESSLTGFADVEAVPSADNPRLIRNPELADAMKQSITASIEWGAGNVVPDVRINVASPPENIAFDVILRAGGSEHPLYSLRGRKGESGTHSIQAGALAEHPASTVELVLRSSPREARATTDLYEIWDGEIVLRDIPVPQRPAAPPKSPGD